MVISFLKAIDNLRRRQTSQATARHPLMLAGISQDLFLRNWGNPETRIFLKEVGGFQGRRVLYLIVNLDDEADYSIWIYKNRDRVLFFKRKRLNLHFKWSGYGEVWNQRQEEFNVKAIKVASAFTGRALALVA